MLLVIDLTPNSPKRGHLFVCSRPVLHSEGAATEWSGPDRSSTMEGKSGQELDFSICAAAYFMRGFHEKAIICQATWRSFS